MTSLAQVYRFLKNEKIGCWSMKHTCQWIEVDLHKVFVFVAEGLDILNEVLVKVKKVCG